jgi:hypothetical protein
VGISPDGIIATSRSHRKRDLKPRCRSFRGLWQRRFSAIDTVVKSPTFWRVVAALPMRSVQIVTRFRF